MRSLRRTSLAIVTLAALADPVFARADAPGLTFRMLTTQFGMNCLASVAGETPALRRRVTRAVDAAGR